MHNNKSSATITALAGGDRHVDQQIAQTVAEFETEASPVQWTVNDVLCKIAHDWDADQRWALGNTMADIVVQAHVSGRNPCRDLQTFLDQIINGFGVHAAQITDAVLATDRDPSRRPLPNRNQPQVNIIVSATHDESNANRDLIQHHDRLGFLRNAKPSLSSPVRPRHSSQSPQATLYTMETKTAHIANS